MIREAGQLVGKWSVGDWAGFVTVASVIGGLGMLLWRKILRPMMWMTQDWHGTVARPGVDARPGVMERLHNHDQEFAFIRSELSLNHGHSVKDTVIKIADRIGVDPDARPNPLVAMQAPAVPSPVTGAQSAPGLPG